jgi:glucose/arabinose dehydrogenase
MKTTTFATGVLLGLFAAGALEAQTVDVPALRVELVAQLPSFSTGLTFIGPDDMLVLQKGNGRVLRVTGGVVQALVLDVNVESSGERGLLGITKDPDFRHNGFIYLYYTEAAGLDGGSVLGNRLYRYRWNGSALVEPRLLLDLPFAGDTSHNGGVLVFGQDDRLYTVIGDAGRRGKLQNVANGADPDDTGSIFRTDGFGLSPADNPFYDSQAPLAPLGRVFAYGVRNSFGLAVDPVTGDLWDTENGPESMDEINRVLPGSNSGWVEIMGPDSRSPGSQQNLWVAPGSAYSDPEFSWFSTVAPTALGFVESRRLGCAMEHRLLVGNVNCGEIYRFALDASRSALSFASPALQDLVADNLSDGCSAEQAEIEFGHGFGIVTDIENGPDGLVYILSMTTNSVYRLRPVTPVTGDSDGDLVPDACDCGGSDPSAWKAPPELRRLRPSIAGDLQLGWDDLGGVTGSGTTYRVVTGALSELQASASFSEACTLDAGSGTPDATDTRADPPPGDGFWYLVRAENGCGNGTFGDGSGPIDPRDALDASTPLTCN